MHRKNTLSMVIRKSDDRYLTEINPKHFKTRVSSSDILITVFKKLFSDIVRNISDNIASFSVFSVTLREFSSKEEK